MNRSLPEITEDVKTLGMVWLRMAERPIKDSSDTETPLSDVYETDEQIVFAMLVDVAKAYGSLTQDGTDFMTAVSAACDTVIEVVQAQVERAEVDRKLALVAEGEAHIVAISKTPTMKEVRKQIVRAVKDGDITLARQYVEVLKNLEDNNEAALQKKLTAAVNGHHLDEARRIMGEIDRLRGV